jgi:hypothetical protein
MNNLEWLASLKANQIHLTFNEEPAINYVTVKQWIEEYEPRTYTDVEPEELQRMKDTNSLWQLQIYPDTPVGFYVWFGATMESVLAKAREHFADTYQ